MKKTILGVFLILTVFISLPAQKGMNVYNHGGKEQVHYIENFDGPDKQWHDNLEIRNGYCLINGEYLDGVWNNYPKRILMDETRNYQIETKVSILGGARSNEVGLIFGMDSEYDQYYFFGINSKQKYSILWRGPNTLKSGYGEHDHALWEKNTNIKLGIADNKLTVRKTNDYFYFFINEALVDSMPLQVLYGHEFGFGEKYGNVNAKFDYLKISYLEEKRADSGPRAFIKTSNGSQNQISTGTNTVTTPTVRGSGSSVNSPNGIDASGKFYALLIGNNEYDHLDDLDYPISDIQKVKSALSRYQFDKIIEKTNTKREDLFETLENLKNQIGPTDNLLIFYAGHGYYDTKNDMGYWHLTDSKANSRASWFSNDDLLFFLKAINSKHTLLITDACFSGSILRYRNAMSSAPRHFRNMYEEKSREVMTSGSLKAVPDESKFLDYLVKRLDENKDKFLDAESLFTSFKKAVMIQTDNKPQFGDLKIDGSDGGDFIFILK